MSNQFLSTPQERDPGSEAVIGFDYQRHIAVRRCIEMIEDREVRYVLCEFHEDVVQIRRGPKTAFVQLGQVKKRENEWKLSDLTKAKTDGKKGILAALFYHLQQGKDVGELSFVGCGRCSGKGDYSLQELAGLLSIPKSDRDPAWNERINEFADHLADKLSNQGIDRKIVRRALPILRIELDYPHHEAIERENQVLLDKVLRGSFEVELNMPGIDALYQKILGRVRQISTKARQTWDVKSISRDQMIELMQRQLQLDPPLAGKKQYLTIQYKFTSVGWEAKVDYAIEKRLNALFTRNRLDFTSSKWQDYKDMIHMEWEQYRQTNPSSRGSVLWSGLRLILGNLGRAWGEEDEGLDAEFAEGVFFGMTATCEATLRISA